MLEGLHELVRIKRFPNRSEAIRQAIRDLLIREETWITLPKRIYQDKQQLERF